MNDGEETGSMILRNVFIIAWLATQAVAAEKALAAPDKATRPPLPQIRSLRLEPASLTLADGRDERRVIVWGISANGQKVDVTSDSVLKSESSTVDVDADKYIHGKSSGDGQVLVTMGGVKASLPVKVVSGEFPPIGFVHDVEPVFSKVGCNAGTCHGSAKGKNGFKLSLRGYDPEFDFQALINDISGRRFDRVNVDDSLMLLKPTAEVPHEGRQALKPGSRELQIVRQWIAQGTKFEEPAKARAKKIEVLPADVDLDLPGRTQNILVLAHYADGSTRDVTRDAVFSSNNGDVAVVKDGLVTAVRRGEAAVLVRYEGNYATRLVTVMGDRTGFQWTEQRELNYIDKLVDAKLKKMKILPSDLSTDAEFIRRVSLDLTGLPPSGDRVREFLDDKTPSPAKREKLVDDLLASPDYIEYWANKWADLLQCNSERLGQKGIWVFRGWIRQAIAQNMPYDKFVRMLITARGNSYQNPEVNYLIALRDSGKMTEDISQTFLGVRFNCNKCHDHPFEKWTQNQYYEFGAFFAQVATKKAAAPMGSTGEEVVYLNPAGGEIKHPKTDMDVAPKVPTGDAKKAAAGEDRRLAFADWLASKDNPFFAMAMANRTWSYFFGRGIIEPVDDIRGSNPASNPELLDALRDDFVRSDFDVRKLMRTICLSRTYQLSIIKNKWNEDDTINFSHATPRRLSAEQLLDAVTIATGVRPKFKDLPGFMRAVQVPDGLVAGNDFLALFGRPKRQSACECERTGNVTLSHALNLINGTMIGDAVGDANSRIAKLVEKDKDDRALISDIYLSILNRPATEKELTAIELGEKRLEGAQDLTWALLNSPAFLFNR